MHDHGTSLSRNSHSPAMSDSGISVDAASNNSGSSASMMNAAALAKLQSGTLWSKELKVGHLIMTFPSWHCSYLVYFSLYSWSSTNSCWDSPSLHFTE